MSVPLGTSEASSLDPKGKEQVDVEEGDPDVIVLDPTTVAIHVEAKKRKQDYEISWKFQETWQAKFPWAKVVMDANGKINNVKYTIYSAIESRATLFVNKLDYLRKHSGKRIA